MSGPGGGSGFKGSSTDTPSQTVGDGGFYIKDQGSADADKAGYGQLWIKTGDGAPNDLYFVNEDGQEVRITNGSSIAAAAGASVKSDDIEEGDNSVSISTTSGNITLVNSLTASDGLLIPDNTLLRFGSATAGDATIEYDEASTDNLCFAGANVKFTQDVTFNENVTLGNAATDIVTVSGHLTASNSLEIRGSKEERNLIVTGSSLMMGTGSAYTLIVSGGAGLKIESTNEPGVVNEGDSNAILTLKDAGDDGDEDSAFRAYIQALDHTDDYVWRIGDAWNGGTDLDLRTQVSVADITLKTKASDGGAITLSPRHNVAFDIRPEGQATFSGSVTFQGDLTASQGINIPDDKFLRFGDTDILAFFDETQGEVGTSGDQILVVSGSGLRLQKNQTNKPTTLEVANKSNGINSTARVTVLATNEDPTRANGEPGGSLVAFSDAYTEGFGAHFANDTGVLTNTGSPRLILASRNPTGSIAFYTGGSLETDLRAVIDQNGNVGIGDSAPGTLLQVKGADAYLTLQNSTAEFSAGSCETKIIFEDHGNNALGQIEVSHAGGSDDENGQMILSTNNDSGLQPAITISNSQVVTLDGGVSVNKNSAGAVTVNTPGSATDPHGTVTGMTTQRAGTFVATMDSISGGGSSDFTFSNDSVISIQVANNLVAGDDVIAVTATTQAATGILAGCIAINTSSNFFRIGLHNVGGGAVSPGGTVTVNWVIL